MTDYRPLHGPELPDFWVYFVGLAGLVALWRVFRWVWV